MQLRCRRGELAAADTARAHINALCEGRYWGVSALAYRKRTARRVERMNAETGENEETLEDLTGDEEIIRSGQGEIVDGQAVKTIHVDW